MSPRTSIGLGIRRWLTRRCLTTTSAFANAASVPVLVADGPLEHDVVGRVLVELRRAGLGRLLGVDDRGQRLPVDLDQLERVLRLGLGVSATTAATPSPVHLTRIRGEDARAC